MYRVCKKKLATFQKNLEKVEIGKNIKKFSGAKIGKAENSGRKIFYFTIIFLLSWGSKKSSGPMVGNDGITDFSGKNIFRTPYLFRFFFSTLVF